MKFAEIKVGQLLVWEPPNEGFKFYVIIKSIKNTSYKMIEALPTKIKSPQHIFFTEGGDFFGFHTLRQPTREEKLELL